MAISSREETCQGLQFSYGIHSVRETSLLPSWKGYGRQWLQDTGMCEGIVLLTEGPSRHHPDANHRMEIIDLRQAEPGKKAS
ncbi:MAG: hypothetical protein ACWGN1_04405 [Desulfobulbales bacterium]